METNNQTTKKGTLKWIFLGLGLTAAGASFFGWRYYKKNKKQDAPDMELPDMNAEAGPETAPKALPPATKSAPVNDTFPLKDKSKGPNVKALQEALIAKYGKATFPKLKPDGSFGPVTADSLKKVGLPVVVDESTFNVLTSGEAPDTPATGQALYTAVAKKDFAETMRLLKTLRNTKDYQDTSTAFQNYRISGVRQTLVNGTLNSFSDGKQKDAIRIEFLRMGLKYNGDKWSLSGPPQNLLITVEPTKVWKDPKTSVSVPGNMVLGEMIAEREGYAVFENAGQRFLVNRTQVSFYKP